MRNDTALVEAIAGLALAATTDFAVDDMLRELATQAAAALGVDGAGVMGIRDEDGQRARGRFVHADHLTLKAEQLQELLQQGPCREAMDSQQPVASADLAAEQDRWPQFTPQALSSHLRAVLALPLLSRGRVWGSLDLYRHDPLPWAADDLAAAQLLANVAVSYLVMAHDRDEARSAHEQMTHRALHDQLTSLPNRGLLYDRIEHALASATRRGGSIALAFIDLDRFKTINDTFGHTAGDRVLVEVTHRLAGTLRTGDTLARLAGDEFVLLCEGLPHEPDALELILATITSRLRTVMGPPMRLEGIDVVVSASIGVSAVTFPTTPPATAGRQATSAATAPRRSGTGESGNKPGKNSGEGSITGVTAQDLLRDADTAMYAAKENGRDAVARRDHQDNAATAFARLLSRDLAHALARHQLLLHYQPIVTSHDGRITSVEALLRWDHPDHGLLSAEQFLASVVATGALIHLGAWVIDTACRQLASWRAELGPDAPAVVFCNVSPRELSDPHLQAVITASLETHHLLPADLGLEILEEAFSDPFLVNTVEQLQQQGHPLAVDDFGTGYSSLSRLLGLPITHAKIDKTFVAGLPADSRSRGLVEAVLTVAHKLSVDVIAEGVETTAQRVYLTEAGVPLLQGYALAYPMPAEELTLLLQRTSQD